MPTKRLSGRVKSGSSASGRQSVFKDGFRAIIEQEVKRGRYNPEEDPLLQEHKRRVKKLLNGLYA